MLSLDPQNFLLNRLREFGVILKRASPADRYVSSHHPFVAKKKSYILKKKKLWEWYLWVQMERADFKLNKLLNFAGHTVKYEPLNWSIIAHILMEICNKTYSTLLTSEYSTPPCKGPTLFQKKSISLSECYRTDTKIRIENDHHTKNFLRKTWSLRLIKICLCYLFLISVVKYVNRSKPFVQLSARINIISSVCLSICFMKGFVCLLFIIDFT